VRLNNAGYAAFLAGDLADARSLFARAIEASDTRYELAEHNLARVERAMAAQANAARAASGDGSAIAANRIDQQR
jgi:Flp pilus assembly protein TadD